MHETPLDDREVHVWRIALDGVGSAARDPAECLSREELERAELFRTPRERSRFIAARTALRHILSAYHGMPAGRVPLARESSGRPFVEGEHRLFFSLSHTAGAALIAVAARPVGVDVERFRVVSRLDAIARRVFHPETVDTLDRLSAEQREMAFLDAWTQREAHVKAVGGGLFRTYDELPFDPAVPPDGVARVARARSDGAPWTIARFLPFRSARAAVAAHGAVDDVRIMDWNDVAPLTDPEDS